MFVFTTTAKRKSPLQKQDAADSSALQYPAAPAPSTLRAYCSVHQESIESHMEMKTINGSFITLLNGSDMRSLLNKPHQPGQVLLPLDKAQAADKADVFPCNPAYRQRGVDGDVHGANPTVVGRRRAKGCMAIAKAPSGLIPCPCSGGLQG